MKYVYLFLMIAFFFMAVQSFLGDPPTSKWTIGILLLIAGISNYNWFRGNKN